MFEANPIGWVNAQGELSLMISITCQNSRTEERTYPINPINQVKETARANIANCERFEIVPQRTGPVDLAPYIIATFIAVPTKRQVNVPATCGTERPTLTFAGM
jgi:hypothetical protein